MKYAPKFGASIRSVNLNGFGAEYAVALYYRGHDTTRALPWWRGNRRKPDVGRRTQVRWTSRDQGDLFMYEWDSPSDIFVLVRGTMPEFTIIGWTWGHEGKRRDYFRPAGYRGLRYDSWVIPDGDLHHLPTPDSQGGDG